MRELYKVTKSLIRKKRVRLNQKKKKKKKKKDVRFGEKQLFRK